MRRSYAVWAAGRSHWYIRRDVMSALKLQPRVGEQSGEVLIVGWGLQKADAYKRHAESSLHATFSTKALRGARRACTTCRMVPREAFLPRAPTRRTSQLYLASRSLAVRFWHARTKSLLMSSSVIGGSAARVASPLWPGLYSTSRGRSWLMPLPKWGELTL